MQTSQTGTFKILTTPVIQTNTNIADGELRIVDLLNPKSEIVNPKSGFTLIEILVVVFIISLTIALVMPNFLSTGKNALKTEARHMSSALRYIYDEAVGKKQTYLFNINLDENSWGFTSEQETRSFMTKGGVEVSDVITLANGEISEGELLIEFGPMGPEESILLHLKKGESAYTIIFNHLSGRTKILEGYAL